MVTAIILIQCRRDRVQQIAQEVLQCQGVAEVYSVAGQVDLVAIARVRDNQQIAELVTGGLSGIEGLSKTETLIAFQAFSKFDLDRMFAIGL